MFTVQDLKQAIEKEDIKAVSEILQSKEVSDFINQREEGTGNTPLMYACIQGNIDIIKALLKQGADPNVQDESGNTPMIKCSFFYSEHYNNIIALLLENGANAFMVDHLGRNVLDYVKMDPKGRDLVTILESLKPSKEQELLGSSFRDKCIFISETGAILGLDDSETRPVLVQNPFDKRQCAMTVSGSFPHISLNELLKYVQAYLKSPDCEKKEFYQKIESGLKNLQQYLAMNGEMTAASVSRSFKKKDEISFILPLGRAPEFPDFRHLTALAFYNGRMVYCNRGYKGRMPTGTSVYQLKEGTAITELAANLNPSMIIKISSYTNSLTQDEITDKVEDLAKKLYTNAVSIPSGEQQHDTCNFVNIKSALEGVLFILYQEEMSKTISDDKTLEAQSLADSEKEYKKFTRFIRNERSKELIEAMKEALKSKNEDDIKALQTLIILDLEAHHGQTKERASYKRSGERKQKIADELMREKWILQAFDGTPLLKNILKEIEKDKIDLLGPALQQNATDVIELLRKNGADLSARPVEYEEESRILTFSGSKKTEAPLKPTPTEDKPKFH